MGSSVVPVVMVHLFAVWQSADRGMTFTTFKLLKLDMQMKVVWFRPKVMTSFKSVAPHAAASPVVLSTNKYSTTSSFHATSFLGLLVGFHVRCNAQRCTLYIIIIQVCTICVYTINSYNKQSIDRTKHKNVKSNNYFALVKLKSFQNYEEL